MEHTLKELRTKIEKELPYINIKPYSHNIIGLLLGQIEKMYGKDVVNKTIRELKLHQLGWSSNSSDGL